MAAYKGMFNLRSKDSILEWTPSAFCKYIPGFDLPGIIQMVNSMNQKKDSACCLINKMRIQILLIISVVLFSCSRKEVIIPDDVLKQKELTIILTDIHMTESMISNKSKSDSINYTLNDYLPGILKEHHTDKETFLRSLKFYSDNTQMIQEVYDSVITSLNRIQGELEK